MIILKKEEDNYEIEAHDHVILVGSGRLGTWVAKLLKDMEEDVVIIEKNPETDFIEEIKTETSFPLLVGDAADVDVLEKANVKEATAIIITSNDYLANFEISLKAREINPDIRIVLRMFDQDLAESIKKMFNIENVFSVSALAAPPFAISALSKHIIIDSFEIDGKLLNFSRFYVCRNSELCGKTLEELEKLNLRVIMHKKSRKKLDFHPDLSLTIERGDLLLIMASSNVIEKIAKMNKPT